MGEAGKGGAGTEGLGGEDKGGRTKGREGEERGEKGRREGKEGKFWTHPVLKTWRRPCLLGQKDRRLNRLVGLWSLACPLAAMYRAWEPSWTSN